MNELKTCPACGTQIESDAPAGLCPKCLLHVALAGESSKGSASEVRPTTIASGFEPPAPEELAKRFPHLEIIELIGRGGMGAVYKARQPGLDRLVAVKILPLEVAADPAFAERFTREARALAKLSHQNIVSVFDFGQVDGQFYIMMEYVDGTNLRQLIETQSINPEEALAIVPQICEALQFAHNEGIVHRDIKPENILLDKQGRVKIADFGLAKLLAKTPQNATLTAAHQVMGTLHYMAPEQMRGAGTVDHRADIYSLGVVFYEMLTGQLPIGRFEPPSRKVQVDVRLDEVVLRSLENEPARRYQHVSELKSDVTAISSDRQPIVIPQTVSDRTVFDRLTVITLFAAALWSAVLIALQWGYISSADWYFKKELPYDYLNVWFVVFSVWLAGALGGWWYLLAKSPDSKRSFAEFMQRLQSPDPRMRRCWKPILAYAAIWVTAVIACWPLGDTALTIATGFGVVALPFVAMAIVRWTYADRFRTETSEIASDSRSATSETARQSLIAGPAESLIVVAGVSLMTALGVATWLRFVPNRSLFEQQTLNTLQMMAATHAIYGVFILAAGLCMRRLQGRMLIMLIATIVGIAIPAVLALNVIMEWGRVPQWPVMIPMWLGMPVAIWVTAVLFRRDGRGAFEPIQCNVKYPAS